MMHVRILHNATDVKHTQGNTKGFLYEVDASSIPKSALSQFLRSPTSKEMIYRGKPLPILRRTPLNQTFSTRLSKRKLRKRGPAVRRGKVKTAQDHISYREKGITPETKTVPTYEVRGEKGQVPQGVSYRKKFHKALAGTGGSAVAANDPAGGRVLVHGNAKAPKVQSALRKASDLVRKEQGWGTTTKPTGKRTELQHVEISPKALDRTSNRQGYTPEYTASKGWDHTPGRSFYGGKTGRYGLKLRKPGAHQDVQKSYARPTYTGWLSKRQVSQLRGDSPVYQKQNTPKFLSEAAPRWARPGTKGFEHKSVPPQEEKPARMLAMAKRLR